MLSISLASVQNGLTLFALWGPLLGLSCECGCSAGGTTSSARHNFVHGFWLGVVHIDKVSLVLGGLSPTRLQMLQSLVDCLFRYRRVEIIYDLPSSVHQSYTIIVDIGQAWFCQVILAQTMVDPTWSWL